MAEEFVTVQFHNEYAKRMEDEHARQNHRISTLERAIEEYNNLALAIERLTMSVQSMVEEQKKQGDRLETLESRDGEMWRNVIKYAATAVVSIIIGYAFSKLGM